MLPRSPRAERTPLRILVVDDCREDRELYRRLIARGFAQEHVIEEAETAAEGLARMEVSEPHCIVLDHRLPDGDGLTFLAALQRTRGEYSVPVVMLTGGGDETVAVEAMKRGAQDYLRKSAVTVEGLQRAIHLAMKRVSEEQQLRRSASVDDLTGVWNRRMLLQRLDEETERARIRRKPLTILMVDLDHFKRVNDEHGHRAGDVVLDAVGRLLRDSLRASDFAGRYGGEEFCVVLPETGLVGARIVAERLRRSVALRPIPLPEAKTVRVACSVGVAELDPAFGNAIESLERADRALYRAKAQGRNRVELAPPVASQPAVRIP